MKFLMFFFFLSSTMSDLFMPAGIEVKPLELVAPFKYKALYIGIESLNNFLLYMSAIEL